MGKKNLQKSPILLLNSDENILKILKQSNAYLETYKAKAEKIQENLWIQRSLTDLVPETLDNFWSGHIFPLTEAEYELESSVEFCKLGFYKHAIAALRNVLELGLLSVYWDIEGKSHIDIQKWLGSNEPTPFKQIVFEKLKTNPNIKSFDDKHKLFDETAELYKELCDYAHTKGLHFSSHKLSKSNINTFNEESLRKWLDFMCRAIKTIVTFHILKYPVALQYTPIDNKFGLNGPVGGFLNPGQVEKIKKLFNSEWLKTLQEISNNDPEAKSLAEWINKKPDITELEFRAQIEAQDKQWIEMQGFDHWLKNEKKMYKHLQEINPEEYKQKLDYFKKMRIWAKEEGYLKPPQER